MCLSSAFSSRTGDGSVLTRYWGLVGQSYDHEAWAGDEGLNLDSIGLVCPILMKPREVVAGHMASNGAPASEVPARWGWEKPQWGCPLEGMVPKGQECVVSWELNALTQHSIEMWTTRQQGSPISSTSLWDKRRTGAKKIDGSRRTNKLAKVSI